MLEKFSLKGKIALVTGGSRGLGKAMALALAKAGADLAVAARTEPELKQTVGEISSLGRQAAAFRVDVASVPQIHRMIQEVVLKFGRLDILVNAAGMNIRKPVLDVTEGEWDLLLSVNLKSAFFAAQAAAKVMIPRGRGKIINVASLTSKIGLPNICMYGASKGGIAQMTRGMAVEWARYNINVNAIGPGYFKTAMTAPLFKNEETATQLKNRIPLGRTGIPEDLAGATVFLASEASDYITGQIIYVDGGWLAG
ncbi:MAG: glucose 1-dehydrogenase [Armatimonadetes bacterium]|nr:glucose 1-dehydrogenase [Armatimonadota bacterium]